MWTSPANAIDRPRHQVVLPRNNGAGNERWKRAPQRRRRRAEGPAARTHVGTEGQSRRRPCPAAALGPRLLRTSERKRRRAPGNRRPLEVPGHARVERFTRYVIFHPKRPSEAPGSPRKCPASPRKPSKRPRNRAKPPRNAPEVAAEGTPGSKARGHGGTKWADTADRRPPEGVRTARNRRRNARPDRWAGVGGQGSRPELRFQLPGALRRFCDIPYKYLTP